MDGGPQWGLEHCQAEEARSREARMDEIARLRKALAEARKLIGHIGWTSCEYGDVIEAAERWLEEYKSA